jgi:hypothetical protein
VSTLPHVPEFALVHQSRCGAFVGVREHPEDAGPLGEPTRDQGRPDLSLALIKGLMDRHGEGFLDEMDEWRAHVTAPREFADEEGPPAERSSPARR